MKSILKEFSETGKERVNHLKNEKDSLNRVGYKLSASHLAFIKAHILKGTKQRMLWLNRELMTIL